MTRSNGSWKKGAPRRTEPIAAVGASRADSHTEALATSQASVSLAASGRSRARQRRAADVTTRRQEYQGLREAVAQRQDELGTLAPAVAHVRKVTASSWDGRFQYSPVKDLSRTTNDLEQDVGTARHVGRRVSGRTRVSPTLVVRGSVRVVAVGASRLVSFSAADVRLTDVAAWQALRQTLTSRHEGRRRQLRSAAIRKPLSPYWNKASSNQFCRRRKKTLGQEASRSL
jgi:hypothetical protein